MSAPSTPIACCRPLGASSLSIDEAEAAATLFRALGDPARVRIVNLLATTEAAVCVCELLPALRLAQPTVSHHLRKLVEAGLLDREERGRWAYYSLNPEAAARLSGLVDLKGDEGDDANGSGVA
ncbi:MAG: ArsR/SmtB family transcription factor [Gaiellaceae bacterium]